MYKGEEGIGGGREKEEGLKIQPPSSWTGKKVYKEGEKGEKEEKQEQVEKATGEKENEVQYPH